MIQKWMKNKKEIIDELKVLLDKIKGIVEYRISNYCSYADGLMFFVTIETVENIHYHCEYTYLYDKDKFKCVIANVILNDYVEDFDKTNSEMVKQLKRKMYSFYNETV